MESLPRSLNYELPHDLHFDKYAQQILENSKTVIASTPTITTFDASATSSSDFLQKLGASLINSIQLQHLQKTRNSESAAAGSQLDMEFPPHRVVLDSSSFDSLDDMQKQLEYDKFMNEVWIGIVLTLILISMVFCVCSCFLYHQFRTWKRNYHNTVAQAQDLESMKLQPDLEDPVPEYTLVSGLPSYEAALELLHKTPKSCLIVYPSVFSVFNTNEKTPTDIATTLQASQEQQQVVELTTPLLSTATTTAQTSIQETVKSATLTIPTYAEATNMTAVTLAAVTTNEKASMQARNSAIATGSATTTTAVTASNVTYQKAPSYEEAFCVKTDMS